MSAQALKVQTVKWETYIVDPMGKKRWITVKAATKMDVVRRMRAKNNRVYCVNCLRRT